MTDVTLSTSLLNDAPTTTPGFLLSNRILLSLSSPSSHMLQSSSIKARDSRLPASDYRRYKEATMTNRTKLHMGWMSSSAVKIKHVNFNFITWKHMPMLALLTSIDALWESFLINCNLIGDVGITSMSSNLKSSIFSCSSTPWLWRDLDRFNVNPIINYRKDYKCCDWEHKFSLITLKKISVHVFPSIVIHAPYK